MSLIPSPRRVVRPALAALALAAPLVSAVPASALPIDCSSANDCAVHVWVPVDGVGGATAYHSVYYTYAAVANSNDLVLGGATGGIAATTDPSTDVAVGGHESVDALSAFAGTAGGAYVSPMYRSVSVGATARGNEWTTGLSEGAYVIASVTPGNITVLGGAPYAGSCGFAVQLPGGGYAPAPSTAVPCTGGATPAVPMRVSWSEDGQTVTLSPVTDSATTLAWQSGAR